MEGICWHLHVQFETNFNFSDGNYEYHKTNKHGTLIDPSDTSHQVTTHDHFLVTNYCFKLLLVCSSNTHPNYFTVTIKGRCFKIHLLRLPCISCSLDKVDIRNSKKLKVTLISIQIF